MRAIAQIHEQLYASDDLREVEVGSYLSGLAGELVQLHDTATGGVKLRLNVVAMVLPIDKAIPVGLIANELIVNSLKHGLRERTGDLALTLDYVAENMGRLRVEDSGPGLPAGFDVSKGTSMGYRLLNLLVRQIRGRLHADEAPGASVTITFPVAQQSKNAGG